MPQLRIFIHNTDGHVVPFAGRYTRPKNGENVSRLAIKVELLRPTDTENLAIRIEKQVENDQ